MAKKLQNRRPQQRDRDHRHDRPRALPQERERPVEMEDVVEEPAEETTTALEAPPPVAARPTPPPAENTATTTGEDVGAIDAETNAKYEQVKGQKLYIKDLQQMEVTGLHELARDEGIQDYLGMKKQDLIFQ